MSYLGNSPTQQNFVAGSDQFNGTGSQTVFTLSRAVNTVFDIFVTVSNVPQDPFTAYTVAGNTLTFDGAPASGTNNIDVVYRATNVQMFVPSPGVSQQFSIGTAASPAITFVGDTNTGIYSPAADTIAFTEGGTEVARFNSAGNFGIGTSSPVVGNSRLTVITGITAQDNTTPALQLYNPNGGADQKYLRIVSTTTGVLNFEKVNDAYSAATGLFGVTSAGLFQFNSGYGSVATAYGCRAWVNFNGTGTVAIRASGNVSSITDNGTGIYTVNFTTAMPDTNYTMIGTSGALSPSSGFSITMGNNAFTTSTAQIYTTNNVAAVADQAVVGVAFFR